MAKFKKYFIVDSDGEEYTVEERDEEEVVEEKVEEPIADEGLSEEEIAALKKLAAVADKLIGMIETSDACGKDEEVEEEEIVDEDEEVVDEDIDEEVIDTDEELRKDSKKRRDSKSSVGAIERKRVRQDDSLTDEVADAWAKRYGGNK